MSKKPTVLMILDGYGLNNNAKGNAVAEGKTPVMDSLMKEYPFVEGNASGMAVGLPDDRWKFRGRTSEYGGRKNCISGSTKITKAIQDGDFFENRALLGGM